MLKCPNGKIFNKLTKKCVEKEGEIGKLIEEIRGMKKRERKKLLEDCDEGMVRNPVTNECVRTSGRLGKIIIAEIEQEEECPEGTILNPATGNCVSVTGKIGQKIEGKHSCLAYPNKKKFKPRKEQELVMNFFANTKEKGIILYHGLGSGKCVLPDTLIYINGNIEKIQDIWNSYYNFITCDNEGGEWSVPKNKLITNSIDHKNKMVETKVKNLYRQYINENIIDLVFESGKKISLTKAHQLLSDLGWTRDFKIGQNIAFAKKLIKFSESSANSAELLSDVNNIDSPGLNTSFSNNNYPVNNGEINVEVNYKGEIKGEIKDEVNDNEDIRYERIKSIEERIYRGYVYDLEIEKYHNYVGNGIMCHNTCTAIMTIDNYLEKRRRENNPVKKVYIISPGSLRENFISQYCSICGEDKDRIKDFEFISYNYSNLPSKLPDPSEFDNCVILIDEAHGLISSAANDSTNATELYDILYESKKSKIILLTGTPLTGNYLELYFLIKMVKPEAFDNLIEYNQMLQLEDGVYYPVDNDIFKERISGVVSYLKGLQDFDANTNSYPTVTSGLVNVTLTKEQYALYLKKRGTELSAHPPNERDRFRNPNKYKKDKTLYYLAISMLRSRQILNVIYPEKIQTMLDDPKLKGSVLPDLPESNGGWITNNFINRLSSYSPKIVALINKIERNPGKQVVYSEFKTRYGTTLIQSVLQLKGYSCLVFTGDLNDNTRRLALQNFNSSSNLNGEKFQLMIITTAGAEGINLLQVRALHILESSINEIEIQQVIGRANRYLSHSLLPSDQQTLKIYRYMGVLPGPNISSLNFQQIPADRYTSDQFAYLRGRERLRSVSYLDKLLKSYSVVPV